MKKGSLTVNPGRICLGEYPEHERLETQKLN